MPTAKETPRSLLAHCPSAKCANNRVQRAVQGIEVETSWTYQEQAGDGPITMRGVERSVRHFRFPDDADDSQRKCNLCQRGLELSDQPRPKYENLSGFAQDGLLNTEKWSPGGRSAEVDQKLLELAEKLSGG